MDASAIIEIIQSGGILAGLILVVYGGKKRWWYWAHQYDEMKRELEAKSKATAAREHWWRSVALSSLNISERMVMGEPDE